MANYMNEVYTDEESIIKRYINLMLEARALFPHSKYVTITIATNDKDKAEFSKVIEETSKGFSVTVIGEKLEGRQFSSYQFADVGTIKLEV